MSSLSHRWGQVRIPTNCKTCTCERQFQLAGIRHRHAVARVCRSGRLLRCRGGAHETRPGMPRRLGSGSASTPTTRICAFASLMTELVAPTHTKGPLSSGWSTESKPLGDSCGSPASLGAERHSRRRSHSKSPDLRRGRRFRVAGRHRWVQAVTTRPCSSTTLEVQETDPPVYR